MSKFLHQQPIILASGSAIRCKLLSTLGIKFLIAPSNCDEDAIKSSFQSTNVIDLGFELARCKALEVSFRFPKHYVIAADQLCVIDKQVLDKPLNHDTAVQHLRLLSGKDHQQIACLCLAHAGEIIWQHHETAWLTMNKLSENAIESYLQIEKPYHSCGAYQYETMGKWLFNQVRGNEEAILGLPLLPLINALVEHQAVKI